MHHPCCYRSALDSASSFCGDCGGPLLRCAAFDECSGLVDTDGLCSVCIAPELYLDAGAAESASVGGALALPLVVRNAAQVGRPLFLRGLWVRESGGGDWRAIDVAWERLDAGASAPAPVDASSLERSGTHRVEVLIAVASRWRWREEVVAFSATLEVTVEGSDAVSVQQNITYAPGSQSDAGAPQTGATIYAPFRMESSERGAAATTSKPRALELVRAGRLEREFGLRGGRDGVAVPRAARLVWSGFGVGTTPVDGPIVTSGGSLTLGRARSKAAGGPNDVRLLALRSDGPAGDTVDEAASRGISRRHLDLWIENDRLMLRVESERGVSVNSVLQPRGSVLALGDGDTFSPLRGEPTGATVRVRFEIHHDVVHAVELRVR